jgi:hypothetical protein
MLTGSAEDVHIRSETHRQLLYIQKECIEGHYESQMVDEVRKLVH